MSCLNCIHESDKEGERTLSYPKISKPYFHPLEVGEQNDTGEQENEADDEDKEDKGEKEDETALPSPTKGR